ncbi:hypothetical protein FRB96_000934 [Tulasnella sp. 330]|nr:hypothetical protein FRB96_000934 [Tulasnella sp. 330]
MAEAAAAEDEGETGEKGTGGKRVNKSSNTIAINKDDRANSGNDDDGAEDYGPEAEHSSLVQAVRHAMSYTPLPIDQQTSVSKFFFAKDEVSQISFDTMGSCWVGIRGGTAVGLAYHSTSPPARARTLGTCRGVRLCL